MLFEDAEKRFELLLTGYQFPDIVDHDHGANWLEVRISVHLPEGTYSASSPCLLTWEVGWIVRWLENIAADIPHDEEYDPESAEWLRWVEYWVAILEREDVGTPFASSGAFPENRH